MTLEISEKFAKKTFVAILLGLVMLMVCVHIIGYLGAELYLKQMLQGRSFQELTGVVLKIVERIQLIFDHYFQWVIPVSAGVVLICAIFLWGILRLMTGSLFKELTGQQAIDSKQSTGARDHADQRIEQERKRRVFLHMLTILQREGRLLDFFNEDLALYNDEQIGAAVRSIQEDCKKAIKKYIDPKPVFDSDEEEEITVEPGFDMDMIKLVGNVAGDPPFRGILKHRGWKAGKKEVPRLSDLSDSGIIAPAEIEVR